MNNKLIIYGTALTYIADFMDSGVDVADIIKSNTNSLRRT